MQLTHDYIKASNGTANASLMTVQSVRAEGATAIVVNTTAGAPTNFIASMGTPHTFTDPVTSETITIISEATAVDFAGHIDNGQIEIDYIAPGYEDHGSAVGDIIVIRPTTLWADILAEYLSPTGMVSPFAGTAAPEKWLLCDGASVLRADYPRLFDVIGTTYGAVDASNFNLPDLRSRFPMGVGQGTIVATAASTDVNVTTDAITIPAGIMGTTARGGFNTGQAVVFTTTGAAPGGLVAGTTYYIIYASATSFYLATNRLNSAKGTKINITSQGTGTHTFTLTLSNRELGYKGGEERHTTTPAEMLKHGHRISLEYGTTSVNVANPGQYNQVRATSNNYAGDNMADTPVETNGASDDFNITSPHLALNYIIKT